MPWVVSEAEHHEQRKHRSHDRESRDRQKIDGEDESQLRLTQSIDYLFPAAAAGRRNPRGMIARDRLWKGEVEQYHIRECQAAGKQKRNVDAPTAQNPTNSRTKNKPQSKGCADQSHPLGAIFLCRDICDVGLSSRN